MMRNGDPMINSTSVQEQMAIDGMEKPGVRQICSVLRKDMAMKHKKVHMVQPNTNSERSLVLRSRFGHGFLGQLLLKKRFLNIDESNLGESNYLRRSWQG